jgi:hypothetical protein
LWRNLALGAVLAAAVLVAALLVFAPGSTPPPGPTPPPVAAGPQLYVDPAGNDTNDGSAGAPLQTIQRALDEAQPGTTINLAPGEYREQPATQRDGAAGAPITIKGPETGQDRSGRYQATLYGTERIFNIDHSYYVLDGFTIDGQEKLKDRELPDDLSAITAFKQSVATDVEDGRLIYIGSSDESRDMTGIEIRNMFLSGAGGECVRLRNNAHDNVIADSVIQYCGLFGKKSDSSSRFEFHNGEGVYIGTSPKSDSQPMHENDTSSGNLVTGNIIHTFGSSASTSRRTRTTTCSRTTSAPATPSPPSSTAAASSCAATTTSCATTRSATRKASPSRSRVTATSTTRAATSSRATGSPAWPERRSSTSRTPGRGRCAATKCRLPTSARTPLRGSTSPAEPLSDQPGGVAGTAITTLCHAM